MLKIKVMKGSGYCLGVRRAMDLVERAVVEGPHPVWTLGSVVHNPVVEAQLAAKGVKNVDSPLDCTGGTLILRSHGTAVEELNKVPHGVVTVDTVCPYVKRTQQLAKDFAGRGYTVVLVGDPSHPEMHAVLSHAGGTAFCVPDAAAAERIAPQLEGKAVCVLSQTTARESEVEKVLETLRERGISIQSENTICTVTHDRQEAIAELAKECQVILVVGGRTSANTGQLLKIASESGAQAYLVESSEDVSADWFSGKRTVGVAAGASTPDWVIKEVVGKVEEIEKSMVEKEHEDQPTKAESPSADDVPAKEESAEEPSTEDMEVTDEKTAAEMYDESFRSLEAGQIIKGRVVSVDDNGALVDVGAKSEGLIPASELNRKSAFSTGTLSPGDEIMVYVVSSDSAEGGLRLSKRKADEDANWQKLEEAFEQGTVIEAPVSQEVKGGLVVDVGLRGFVPASQVERGYVNDLSKYVGQTLRLKVLELDRSKNRVVLSQRVVLEEEHQKLCQETWESIAEGQVRAGVVKGLTDFGVFVDLGGVDGLLHISELSWGRVKHPSEVVREGQEIEVKVLRVDKEKGKISLGRKQVLPDPWLGVEEKYPVGSVVTGEVTRTAPFGAFVQLEPGVEGLVHISEVAVYHVTKPEDAVRSGDTVRVKVLRVRPDERRISLSIKQADQLITEDGQAPASDEPESPAMEVEPAAAPAAPEVDAQEPAAPETVPEQAEPEPVEPEPQAEPAEVEECKPEEEAEVDSQKTAVEPEADPEA
jgi:4-hydroxy-3-methylbut-2-enyl diphosphate reductase